MKIKSLFLVSLTALLAACGASPDSTVEDGNAEVAAEPSTSITASKELSAYGIATYEVTTSEAAATVLLYDTNGQSLGALSARDPSSLAKLDLDWKGRHYAFALDVRQQESLSVSTETASGLVYSRNTTDGAVSGDAQSLALYNEIAGQWQMVAKIFNELNLKNIGSASASFISPASAGGSSITASDACNYCSRETCNFLGWPRQFHGHLNLPGHPEYGCSGYSYCGCDCDPVQPWPCN